MKLFRLYICEQDVTVYEIKDGKYTQVFNNYEKDKYDGPLKGELRGLVKLEEWNKSAPRKRAFEKNAKSLKCFLNEHFLELL